MVSISIQFSILFSPAKKIYIYRQFHNKNTASKQNYMHNIIYTIGEKKKSQKVGDLYDDLALVRSTTETFEITVKRMKNNITSN